LNEDWVSAVVYVVDFDAGFRQSVYVPARVGEGPVIPGVSCGFEDGEFISINEYTFDVSVCLYSAEDFCVFWWVCF
jgi:hypothetical protein